MARLLTIMGSGETAPTMAKVHRALFERLEAPAPQAMVLDTPYGFQENADELSSRACDYLARHLGARPSVASWRRRDAEALVRERALAAIRAADYVFAGPGSPSYALGVWRGTPLREVLVDKLRRGGCVTFASAAALTLGISAVPVYEIYKVGQAPQWLPALDILSAIGLCAAVIPHYDNAEGGTHDTRYCYLGERRLRQLEPALPADAFVLGVDEHTACVFDLDADTAGVIGRGGVTVRRAGRSQVFASPAVVPIAELAAAGQGGGPAAAAGTEADGRGRWPARGRPPQPAQPAPPVPSAAAEAQRLERAFSAALDSRDVDRAVAALLELDDAVFEWRADTDQNETMDRARSLLRGMVVRLGEAAVVGVRDPRELLAPLADALVAVREQARAARDWGLADDVRERMTAAGIEVRDTPEGPVWLPSPSR